jgi:hypothetical protein
MAMRHNTYKLPVIAVSTILIFALTMTATMGVQNIMGYPPQASFFYWPARPYENMTVSFDASSSTPESFNDTIINYKWDFGDGTPKIDRTDPMITHAFPQASTFVVTLNVTDSQNLWSTTSKPITMLPQFGPTANFTWTPTTPLINETTTFNASNSILGWSKTTGGFSPITNYTWNFADGTGYITVSTPTIGHSFGLSGNYSVALTITDAVNRQSTKSATIQVLNMSVKIYDFDHSGIIDMKDLRRVAKAFGSRPGWPNWDIVVDINHDNVIDMKDIRPVAQNFGMDP